MPIAAPPSQPSPRTAALGAALALVACAGVLATLAGCGAGTARAENGKDPAAKDDRPPLVRVAAVEKRLVRREIENTAYLESEHEVTVFSKVPGRVEEVLVDEGDRVQPDQVLARLDDREARAALKALEAQLEDRRVRLRLARLEEGNAKRRIEQARIERDRTKAEFERQSSIDPSLVSPKVLEEARFAYQSAEEALAVAKANAEKAALDTLAAASAIEELTARLEEQKVRLAEHEVRAYLAGVVTQRNIKGGETITTATGLFVVTDLEHLIGYVHLPQVQLPLARTAKEVAFTTDAYGDRQFVADVDYVSPVVDRTTGSFRLRFRVRADDVALLRPGMFLRVRVLTETRREALMVPKAALLSEGERYVAFVLRGEKVHKLDFEPGLEEQDWIECRNTGDEALRPGDRVVVSGHDGLKDQERVEVARDE